MGEGVRGGGGDPQFLSKSGCGQLLVLYSAPLSLYFEGQRFPLCLCVRASSCGGSEGVCVCVRVRACVRACVRGCVRACVCVWL